MHPQESTYTPYRWIILAIYFILAMVIEIQWLAYASITEVAKNYYHVSNLSIDFLSMIYMIVFIVASLPASYYIDTYGLKKGICLGAYLTAIFAATKAISGDNFTLVVISQFGLAAAQPFILNALTKLGADWFPQNERATVAGIGTLAQYIGIIIALTVTPFLINESITGFHFQQMLLIYGAISVISSILIVIFMRDPRQLPEQSKENDIRISPLKSTMHILRNRDMQILIFLFFIGLGIFNAISTCIDQITPHLMANETGMIGGFMLVGGVIGALILPVMSDKMKKRKPFIILCMALMIPGLIGFTVFQSFPLLMASAFVFGFFIMSAGPIAFQYGAEASYPATESASQGILLLAGQISGILFVLGVNTIGITISMISFIVLTFINVLLSLQLKESYNRS